MGRLAEGDRAAAVTLYVTFGAVISGVVRRHLGRFGVRDVGVDDLDGIVLDACFALADCASGWDPSKHVPPWTWAEHRMVKVVSAWIGQYADELDERAYDMPTSVSGRSDEADPLELLMTCDDPRSRLLRDALDCAGVSARDRRLLVETELQTTLGDPSPASTIALEFGMQPAAVRQAVKRSKDRLRQLAAAEARYAPLTDIALLA